MHRYRKGQTYRPPTAAESAAHADAAEAHRRAPESPQDYHPPGQIIVVKTPPEGIPARDGETIFWAWCERSIHVDDLEPNPAAGTTKLRVDTEERLIVHNLLNQSIPGNWHVQTALTDCGTRFVLPVVAVVGFTLTEDMGETTANEASANIHKTWDAATESYTGSDSGVVKDTRGIFAEATDTSKGLGLLRWGDEREIVDPYNIECP